MSIKASVKKCFFAVEPHVVFTSLFLPATKKNVFPTLFLSGVVIIFCVTVIVGFLCNNYRKKFINACQNLLKLIKF